jgi:hypothetical protein
MATPLTIGERIQRKLAISVVWFEIRRDLISPGLLDYSIRVSFAWVNAYEGILRPVRASFAPK